MEGIQPLEKKFKLLFLLTCSQYLEPQNCRHIWSFMTIVHTQITENNSILNQVHQSTERLPLKDVDTKTEGPLKLQSYADRLSPLQLLIQNRSGRLTYPHFSSNKP